VSAVILYTICVVDVSTVVDTRIILYKGIYIMLLLLLVVVVVIVL